MSAPFNSAHATLADDGPLARARAAIIEQSEHSIVELARLEEILALAIVTLQENFQGAMHALAGRAARTGSPVDDERGGIGEALSSCAPEHASSVEAQLNKALGALQFEDMANQLIRRIRDRLAHIRLATDANGAHRMHVPPLHSAVDQTRPVTFGEPAPGAVELF